MTSAKNGANDKKTKHGSKWKYGLLPISILIAINVLQFTWYLGYRLPESRFTLKNNITTTQLQKLPETGHRKALETRLAPKHSNATTTKPPGTRLATKHSNATTTKPPGTRLATKHSNTTTTKQPEIRLTSKHSKVTTTKPPGTRLATKHSNTTTTKQPEIRLTSKHSKVTTPLPKPPKRYKILYWTKAFGDASFWFGLGNRFKEVGCKVQACETTNDKKEYNSSDVIMMHMRDLESLKDLPSYRFSHQKWIFFLRESPPHLYINTSDFNGLFNLTMTYRLDSDIPHPYGRLLPSVKPFNASYNYASGKKELVAWFISNCQDFETRRIKYGKELHKHIPVHIYGKCGNLTCAKNKDCNKMLNENYKFYLSFENSLCKDYMTEKVWKILNMNLIPIVLGGADYKKQLPPHSYIDVRDFPSPKALADYLYLLHKNDHLYNAYFHWKLEYRLTPSSLHDAFCDLCEYLHTNEKKVSVYKRLDLWWNKDIECQSPKKFYKGVADEIKS